MHPYLIILYLFKCQIWGYLEWHPFSDHWRLSYLDKFPLVWNLYIGQKDSIFWSVWYYTYMKLLTIMSSNPFGILTRWLLNISRWNSPFFHLCTLSNFVAILFWLVLQYYFYVPQCAFILLSLCNMSCGVFFSNYIIYLLFLVPYFYCLYHSFLFDILLLMLIYY